MWHLDVSEVDISDVLTEIVRYARTTETAFFLTRSAGMVDVGGDDADTVVTHLTEKFPLLRAVEDTVAT